MLDIIEETTIPIEEIVTIALLTPMGDPNNPNCIWGAPLILWGGPGIGKSSRVIAAAKGTGLPIEEIFSAGHHPEDFTGIPIHAKEGLRRACALDEVNRLVAAKRGILFLDEISGATPSVQAALLKVILKRYIGDTQLPGGVRILAAANPPTEAACGWELEPPLANRFIHVKVPAPGAAAWGEWLITGEGIPTLNREDGEAIIRRGWQEEWPHVRGLFKQFIARRPELLYALPAEGNPDRGGAWPSPRTVEYAARLVTAATILGVEQSKQVELVQAAIGQGAAIEWLTWVRDVDLPTPEEIIEGHWTPDPLRLDVANAAYAAATAYVLSNSNAKKKAHAVKLWNLFDRSCDLGLTDIIGYFSRLLVRGGLSLSAGDKELAKAAHPVLTRLGNQNITSYLPKD